MSVCTWWNRDLPACLTEASARGRLREASASLFILSLMLSTFHFLPGQMMRTGSARLWTKWKSG